MKELLRKKSIIIQMLDVYDFNENEFNLMIEVLEIIKDKMIFLIEKEEV